jgi:hypothetical protein
MNRVLQPDIEISTARKNAKVRQRRMRGKNLIKTDIYDCMDGSPRIIQDR